MKSKSIGCSVICGMFNAMDAGAIRQFLERKKKPQKHGTGGLTMDLIDRNFVLSEIEEEIEAGHDYPEDELINKGLRIARKRVAHAHAVNRWIPCSERLPEEEGQYIVTTTSGKVYIWSFYFSLASKRPYFSGDEKVVAWMPRPKPYEPPKEDET